MSLDEVSDMGGLESRQIKSNFMLQNGGEKRHPCLYSGVCWGTPAHTCAWAKPAAAWLLLTPASREFAEMVLLVSCSHLLGCFPCPSSH